LSVESAPGRGTQVIVTSLASTLAPGPTPDRDIASLGDGGLTHS